MPRAVVVTKLDHARADFDGTLRGVREAFGERVLPVVVPSGDGVTGLLGGSVDDDRRGTLIEAVIEESEDESLMDRYLGGDPVDEDLLVKDLETAVAGARLHPVLAVCGTDGRGCAELLDLCVRGFPSPAEHPAQESLQPERCRRGHGDLRPRRHRWSPRWCARAATSTSAGSASCGCSPGPWCPTRRCTSPATSRRSSPTTPATRTTTRTSGSARWRTRSVRTRCRPLGWSPATSPRSAGSAARRPATRCPARSSRGC